MSGEFSLNFLAEIVRLGGSEMAKKISKRTPARKAKAVKETPRAPLLRGWVDRFKRLFAEDLPVTDYEGTGKFDSQVEKTKLHQVALEKICGGRTAKKTKLNTIALITPDAESGECRVSIGGEMVGLLKKAEGKFLLKKLSEAAVGPCAVRVQAQIRDGRWKKKGPHEDYTVFVCLPKPPPKPAPQVASARDPEAEG